MATRKKKASKTITNCLEREDLWAMRLAASEAERARERHRRFRAERNANVEACKSDLLRAQAQMQSALETEKATMAHEDSALEAALEEQRILAAEIGKRYAVDWKATAFDSDTGMLMPLPG